MSNHKCSSVGIIGAGIQGVCIGTFARNIIYKNIKEKYDYEDDNFWKDLNNIKEACDISDNLIQSNTSTFSDEVTSKASVNK